MLIPPWGILKLLLQYYLDPEDSQVVTSVFLDNFLGAILAWGKPSLIGINDRTTTHKGPLMQEG